VRPPRQSTQPGARTLEMPVLLWSTSGVLQTRCKRTSPNLTHSAGHAITVEPLPTRPDGTRRHLPDPDVMWVRDPGGEQGAAMRPVLTGSLEPQEPQRPDGPRDPGRRESCGRTVQSSAIRLQERSRLGDEPRLAEPEPRRPSTRGLALVADGSAVRGTTRQPRGAPATADATRPPRPAANGSCPRRGRPRL
jgi:hypothetical protein